MSLTNPNQEVIETIVTNPNQEGIEVQNSSILYFSPIEDSMADRLSSEYCKELWLASGCTIPYQPDKVIGNLKYTKTTLKAIVNNISEQKTLLESHSTGSGSYHSYYRAYKKWVLSSANLPSGSNPVPCCHYQCPGFSKKTVVLWVKRDLAQSYISYRSDINTSVDSLRRIQGALNVCIKIQNDMLISVFGTTSKLTLCQETVTCNDSLVKRARVHARRQAKGVYRNTKSASNSKKTLLQMDIQQLTTSSLMQRLL